MSRIDCHSHVASRFWDAGGLTPESLVNAADKLGIDVLCCSTPIVRGMPTPEEFAASNEDLLKAMEEYPGKILGYCFVNPGYQTESLAEIERRVAEDGMVGIKLYNQYKCSDPVVYPIVRKAIELGVPILQHAGYLTDPEEAALQPNISNARDIAFLASMFPEAAIIEAHLGGGGDWEWALKNLRNARNVYMDTSGSVVDAGMVEKAVRYLGAERLLFGTDLSMEEGVGKVLDACISEGDRQLIFGENMKKILGRRAR
ncbi:MAG: amidohydrolase family protein [Candidatus Brockarchaeota archaeon]|nr:amidohydrolase family protein [Candidatus Brockarchaeota archaeon]